MNSVLVTIAPAWRLHQHVLAGTRAASAMTSSVRLPSVALSRPGRITRSCRHRLGGVAEQRGQRHDGATDSTKSHVCASA